MITRTQVLKRKAGKKRVKRVDKAAFVKFNGGACHSYREGCMCGFCHRSWLAVLFGDVKFIKRKKRK